MTVETIVALISASAAVMSLVFGGSLFAKFVKQREEMAVQKYRLEVAEKKLEEAVTDVSALKATSLAHGVKIDEHARLFDRIDGTLADIHRLLMTNNK